MKITVFAALLLSILLTSLVHAGPFDARTTFGQTPARDLDAALKRSKTEKKRVLLFFWNTKDKGSFPGSDMTSFAQLEETKKLMKDHFVLVLLDRDHPDVKSYLSAEQDLEKPQWVFLDSDGNALKTAKVFRNPGVGLKTVQELIAIP